MKIENKLKEIVLPTEAAINVKLKHKFDGFIWGFLLGMLIQLILIIFIIKPYFGTLYWATRHPEEMKWTIERYDMIQKASKVLFFESKMDGVTIVKPQSMQ